MEKGTLRRAYTVCSSEYLLHEETCFTEPNGYPKCLLKRIFENHQQKLQEQN